MSSVNNYILAYDKFDGLRELADSIEEFRKDARYEVRRRIEQAFGVTLKETELE